MLRKTVVGAVLVLSCMGLALAGGDKPNWVKWDAARQLAAATGKPILVYSTVDEKGGGC